MKIVIKNIHSVMDLVTNSSSTLFVIKSDIQIKMIKEIFEKLAQDYSENNTSVWQVKEWMNNNKFDKNLFWESFQYCKIVHGTYTFEKVWEDFQYKYNLWDINNTWELPQEYKNIWDHYINEFDAKGIFDEDELYDIKYSYGDLIIKTTSQSLPYDFIEILQDRFGCRVYYGE